MLAIALFSGLIVYRLFVLSIVRHSGYSLTAKAQSENINNILARGNIYFSSNTQEPALAATNKKFAVAHVIPASIQESEREGIAQSLSGILSMDQAELFKKINSDSKSLRIIARRITNEQVEAVKGLGKKGVGVSYETDRYYPAEGLAAGVLGFLGYNTDGERAGQYGIEEYYNSELSGREPNVSSLFAVSELNPSRLISRILNKDEKNTEEVKDEKIDRPADMFLTIDKNIQDMVEKKLKELLERWEAEEGTIIVQDPQTGKILAMADWPSFNPNYYSEVEHQNFLNGAIQEVYEPGSSFKPLTMATGLDLAKITPQTTFEDQGFLNISGYTIHNFSDRIFGKQTMTQVLENSVNTGTMFVENLVGDDNFLNYVINMGFGQKTGVDLPGEVSGDVTNLYSGRKINFLTASFGQGIAVTPLQLINAYSMIANGGKLMRPYIVDKVVKEGGVQVVTQPEVVSIPISEKTATKVQAMLISVVDNGFDKARIGGYDIAGKTGTAQIPDGSGAYSKDLFIHNFVGFAPAYNSKFVILIKMDKPKGIQFAADSLSPTFKELAQFLLNYYNIPPTRR